MGCGEPCSRKNPEADKPDEKVDKRESTSHLPCARWYSHPSKQGWGRSETQRDPRLSCKDPRVTTAFHGHEECNAHILYHPFHLVKRFSEPDRDLRDYRVDHGGIMYRQKCWRERAGFRSPNSRARSKFSGTRMRFLYALTTSHHMNLSCERLPGLYS